MKLTEDDSYRTSTQYKHWSFTPAQLASQRRKTNARASARVRANVARQRAERAQLPDNANANASASETDRTGSGVDTGANTPVSADHEVDCLTQDEEMRLVDTFCERALELGKFCKFPTEVTVCCDPAPTYIHSLKEDVLTSTPRCRPTGIQFLRRFYLFNSPMTYEGQNISRTAMFIANKTEGNHTSVETYAARFPKVTAEQVLAPEYLLVQALRFNFEIRHPFRGLKGGHMELLEMARGHFAPLPADERTSAGVQREMQHLPLKPGGPPTQLAVPALEKRVADAYAFASNVLKTAALLTDAYFLYTPPQIWLSAHLLADEPLTLFYLSAKLPPTHPAHAKTVTTLAACAALLAAHRSFTSDTTSADAKAARNKADAALIKKLRSCPTRNKLDLVKLNQAQKRDAVEGSGALEGGKAKRRKIQREAYEKEADEFWGPELAKNGGRPV